MTDVVLSSAPALTSSARACCSICFLSSGGSLSRASTVTPAFLLDRGNHLHPQPRPELVDFRRDVEFVVDERPALLDVEILHVDRDRACLDRRRRLLPDDVGQTVGSLLDEHFHARAREILALQLRARACRSVCSSSPPDRPAIARPRTGATLLRHRRASCRSLPRDQMCGNVSAS
mgnify:CR=1 FL=1